MEIFDKRFMQIIINININRQIDQHTSENTKSKALS